MSINGSIIGMYFYQNNQEFYRTGQIVKAIGSKYFLVAIFSTTNLPPIYQVYSLKQISNSTMCLYPTEQDLNNYIAWLEAPPKTDNEIEGNVISFNPKDLN